MREWHAPRGVACVSGMRLVPCSLVPSVTPFSHKKVEHHMTPATTLDAAHHTADRESGVRVEHDGLTMEHSAQRLTKQHSTQHTRLSPHPDCTPHGRHSDRG